MNKQGSDFIREFGYDPPRSVAVDALACRHKEIQSKA
jgi:hypothetical protein